MIRRDEIQAFVDQVVPLFRPVKVIVLDESRST